MRLINKRVFFTGSCKTNIFCKERRPRRSSLREELSLFGMLRTAFPTTYHRVLQEPVQTLFIQILFNIFH
jgi:hypothetical protein